MLATRHALSTLVTRFTNSGTTSNSCVLEEQIAMAAMASGLASGLGVAHP